MKIELKNLTIKLAHQHLMKGDFSARELAENYLVEIEKKNPALNAYLEVFGDVLEQAGAADEKIKKGDKQAKNKMIERKTETNIDNKKIITETITPFFNDLYIKNFILPFSFLILNFEVNLTIIF